MNKTSQKPSVNAVQSKSAVPKKKTPVPETKKIAAVATNKPKQQQQQQKGKNTPKPTMPSLDAKWRE